MSSRPWRTFVALPIEPAVAARVSALVDHLQPELPGMRWVPAGNRHLTLHFLGDTDPDREGEIAGAIERSVADREAIDVAIDGLGVFPGTGRARVLWAGVDAPGVAELAGAIRRELDVPDAGGNPFVPHLTLARVRRKPPARLRAVVDAHADLELGEFRADEVIWFRSHLGGAGARHEPLARFPLGDTLHFRP